MIKKRGNPNVAKAGEPYRWKPGQSGNLKGRPPLGEAFIEKVRELLDKQDTTGKTNREVIAEAFIEVCKDPQMRAYAPIIKELWDRLDGKVVETHKIESDVPVTIIYKLVEGKDATE